MKHIINRNLYLKEQVEEFRPIRDGEDVDDWLTSIGCSEEDIAELTAKCKMFMNLYKENMNSGGDSGFIYMQEELVPFTEELTHKIGLQGEQKNYFVAIVSRKKVR
jgi:hypothetical protein